MIHINDWNLFWVAFGAIGTTLGSLITAFALIIAVKQYLLPLNKRIRIKISSAFPVYDNGVGESLLEVCIINDGIRDVNITSIYLRGRKHSLYINNMQFNSVEYITFPNDLKSGDKCSFYIAYKTLKAELGKMIQKGYANQNDKLILEVHEKTGNKYTCKNKLNVKTLVR